MGLRCAHVLVIQIWSLLSAEFLLGGGVDRPLQVPICSGTYLTASKAYLARVAHEGKLTAQSDSACWSWPVVTVPRRSLGIHVDSHTVSSSRSRGNRVIHGDRTIILRTTVGVSSGAGTVGIVNSGPPALLLCKLNDPTK